MSEYSYELIPDELVAGGYSIFVRDALGEDVAVTSFIAPDWDTAEKVAKAGFESNAWQKASVEGYTEMVDITDV